MEPEYEGHDTISITPIYDTDFSIIWLRNQQNKNLKSYFYDHTAPRKRLRTKDEVVRAEVSPFRPKLLL